MKNGARGLAAGALALAAMALGAGAAQAAADPVITVGADGTTAPVFSYTDAIRERVWVPNAEKYAKEVTRAPEDQRAGLREDLEEARRMLQGLAAQCNQAASAAKDLLGQLLQSEREVRV